MRLFLNRHRQIVTIVFPKLSTLSRGVYMYMYMYITIVDAHKESEFVG